MMCHVGKFDCDEVNRTQWNETAGSRNQHGGAFLASLFLFALFVNLWRTAGGVVGYVIIIGRRQIEMRWSLRSFVAGAEGCSAASRRPGGCCSCGSPTHFMDVVNCYFVFTDPESCAGFKRRNTYANDATSLSSRSSTIGPLMRCRLGFISLM